MVWRWSKTPATNATADSIINWQEGMAPSAVNDSARAEMARVAQWRDDTGGALTTGGVATAYTVSTNQFFTTLAGLNGKFLTIVPHATSGADPTLNVDSLGAKQIRTATGSNLPTGALIEGSPYQVVYYQTADEFIVIGRFGDLFNASNSPDLAAIETLSGTEGILRKTAANTWALGAGIGHLTNGANNRLYGTSATGVSSEITVGTGLSLSAGTLTSTVQSGSMRLIRTVNVSSNVGSVAFTDDITNAYNNYRLVINAAGVTNNNVQLQFQISTDNGDTWRSANYMSVLEAFNSLNGSYTSNLPSTFVPMTLAPGGNGGMTNDEGYGWTGEIQFFRVGSFKKPILVSGAYVDSFSPHTLEVVRAGGMWDGGNNNISAVRVTASAGSINTGSFSLYGLTS